MASLDTAGSDPEKDIKQSHHENVDLSDPDSGLSDEERAAIVHTPCNRCYVLALTVENRTKSLCASLTSS